MSRPLHILIVEDSRLQAKRLMNFLTDQGYEVAHAGDGRQGLEAARIREPDLIITDIIMPVMDGFEMCRRIREDEKLYLTPIVMVTSLSNPEDVLRGLEAGADCYITKPYEGKIMLSRIGAVLSLPRIPRSGQSNGKLQLVMGGKRYVITAARQQILSLLLSTYEDAVLQNMKLREMRAKLVGLNETLEKRVADRTVELRKEIAQRKRIQAEREKLIIELTAARDDLHFRATHDELTTRWNRATILRRLEQELARTGREGTPVGVAIADIDLFKRVNDSYGHLAGDAVLRAVAARIVSVVRPYDSVGRYGGEEFLVVLPGCEKYKAWQVAERLRLSFSKVPIKTPEGNFRITLSIGVTTVEGGKSIDVNSVIRAADEALYRAKNKGRNCVQTAWDV
ncbi:MAG: diguanylate cyclase [Desulfomonilaceae bacterium]|nr:diguanylate cyclase [Desulfomonilaceae bacterium]